MLPLDFATPLNVRITILIIFLLPDKNQDFLPRSSLKNIGLSRFIIRRSAVLGLPMKQCLTYCIIHLGQIDVAILETSGVLSVYFYPDQDVKPRLPVLPDLFEDCFVEIKASGTYACTFCGNVEMLQPAKETRCLLCDHKAWVKAISSCRVR